MSHGGYGKFPTNQTVRYHLAAREEMVVNLGTCKLGRVPRLKLTGYPQIRGSSGDEGRVFLVDFS